MTVRGDTAKSVGPIVASLEAAEANLEELVDKACAGQDTRIVRSYGAIVRLVPISADVPS